MRSFLLSLTGLVLAASLVSGFAACADSSELPVDADGGPSVPPPSEGGAFGDSGPSTCDAADGCQRPSSCAAADFCQVAVDLDPRYTLFTVGGMGKDDVWTAGAAGILMHYDGASWTKVPTDRDDSFHGLWLAGKDDLWVTSNGCVLLHGARASGSALTLTNVPLFEGASAYNRVYGAVVGSPDGKVLLIGGGRLFSGGQPGNRWSRSMPGGTEWTSVTSEPSQAALNALWSNGTDVWSVGTEGLVERASSFWADQKAPWKPFDGQTRSALESIIGFDDGSVWIVGRSGVVRRYSGGPIPRFDVIEVPTKEHLHGIWGTSPTNLWVAGNNGTLLHYDGAKWVSKSIFHTQLETPDLQAIWGVDEHDIWAVGSGVILHIHEGGPTPGVTP